MPHTTHHAVAHLEGDAARPDGTTLAAFAGVALIGGSNAVAIKFGLGELAPFWGAAIRFLGASILLFGAILVLRRVLPTGRALAGALIYGVFSFAGFYAFVYFALLEVSAGTVMVVLALLPLFTVLLAALQGVETLKPRRLLGAVIAATGIALVFYDSLDVASPLALTALIAAGLCGAQGTVTIKRFPRVDPTVENAVAMGFGGVILLALSMLVSEPWAVPSEPESLGSLVWLTVFGSIAMFGLFLFMIRRWTASGASYALLIMPLVTIVLGSVLLGETITWIFAVGTAICLVGVWLGALAPHGAGSG